MTNVGLGLPPSSSVSLDGEGSVLKPTISFVGDDNGGAASLSGGIMVFRMPLPVAATLPRKIVYPVSPKSPPSTLSKAFGENGFNGRTVTLVVENGKAEEKKEDMAVGTNDVVEKDSNITVVHGEVENTQEEQKVEVGPDLLASNPESATSMSDKDSILIETEKQEVQSASVHLLYLSFRHNKTTRDTLRTRSCPHKTCPTVVQTKTTGFESLLLIANFSKFCYIIYIKCGCIYFRCHTTLSALR